MGQVKKMNMPTTSTKQAVGLVGAKKNGVGVGGTVCLLLTFDAAWRKWLPTLP
jgi:hypothetical protein